MNGKAWVVVRQEFLGTVKRPGWLVSTFGMPVFVGLYAGLIFLVSLSARRGEEGPGRVGLVDLSGVVDVSAGTLSESELPREAKEMVESLAKGTGQNLPAAAEEVGGTTEFRPYPDETSALAALAKKEVGAVYVIPADYLAEGRVTCYDASASIASRGRRGRGALSRLLVRSLAARRLPPETVARLVEPLSVTTLTKQPDGTWKERGAVDILKKLGIPLGFMVLLLFAILFNAGALIQGVAEEKENRVIEVILSSVDARSLLLGKLLGLGAAGLLQLAIWLGMALVPLVLLVAGLALSPGLVLLCLAYFVLAFLLYGTLITATGVLGTNAKDMQQYGMFWSIGCAIPAVFMEVLLREPHGATARILSYVPLTSPVTMMIRLGIGGVAWWEVVGTLLLLAVGVVVALRVAARVFRTALLMYGKRPTVMEVFRWMRRA